MTGTGFDGLLVNHAGLNEVTDQLYKMVKDIDDRMNNLERDLAPLQAEWAGNAQAAYNQAKLKWDTAIAEMMQLLGDVGNTVGQSNVDYHAADMRGGGGAESELAMRAERAIAEHTCQAHVARSMPSRATSTIRRISSSAMT